MKTGFAKLNVGSKITKNTPYKILDETDKEYQVKTNDGLKMFFPKQLFSGKQSIPEFGSCVLHQLGDPIYIDDCNDINHQLAECVKDALTRNSKDFISKHDAMTKFIENNIPKTDCTNDGGKTDYYQFKDNWVQAQDVIEDRNMNFSQGNIFKAAFTFNVGRHDGTDYQRELKKIIFFANRELKRLENGQK